MIETKSSDAVVEAALQARVAQRCQRAYVHHLRNGLQAIYASVDVLQRIAEGKAGAAFAPDRVKDLVRKALRSHEQGINDAIAHIAIQNDEPSVVELKPLIGELVSFMNSDAAAHEVILHDAVASLPIASPLHAYVRPSIARLMVLATLVRSIDSLRGGGQVTLDAVSAESRIALQFSLRLGEGGAAVDRAWDFDSQEEAAWSLHAMRSVMRRAGGDVETQLAREADPSSHRIVRVIFQTAPFETRELGAGVMSR